MNRLPIFHDEKTFRDRSDQMFRDMQNQMDQDIMRGFVRPLGSTRTWGTPSFGFGSSSPMADFDRDFFQLRPMHVPPPPSFPPAHMEHTTFPAPMEVLDSKTVDNLFMEDPENKSRLFQMSFDVKDYDPQAVQVRVEDNCLIVEAKHVEVKDGNTKVNKEFSRKIQLPAEVDPEKLTSTLSTDGVLSVKAPVPPRYHNVQGAPASQNNTFTTTFKASPSPTTSFVQQQRQPIATATPSIHSEFHQFPSFSSLPTQQVPAPQQQSLGFYSVPVLSSDNLALTTRDRPLFTPLNDGTNRLRMDLLLDLGRQYSAGNIVVKFDERTRKLTVEATNEERDSSGKTSRCQISRQFELAEKVEPSTLQAIMKGDGQLHVTALTSM